MAAPPKGSAVPDDDNVLRYIARKHVDKEKNLINGSGFLCRPGEAAPSVNWLECFAPPIDNQRNEIRTRKRINYEKRSKLARLNVGRTRDHVSSHAPIDVEFKFVHEPLLAENGYPDDPSHAEINGVPEIDSPEGEMIQDLFVDCIDEQWDADPD